MKHFLPIIVALLLMSNCYAGSGSLVRGMISGALVAAQIIGLAVLLIRYSNKRGRLLALPLALLIAPACHAGMGRNILKGATDQSTRIRILNDDGTPSTDVVAATSGLDLEYVRNGAAPVDLTESDLAATNSAHSDGGIKHLGGGVYRVDPPDAAFATGVDEVSIQGTCTDRVIVGVSHQLVDMSLSGQSAADLKDFADAGYDPSTNRVDGIDAIILDTEDIQSTLDGAPEVALNEDGEVKLDPDQSQVTTFGGATVTGASLPANVESVTNGAIADADFASDVRLGINWAEVSNATTSNVLSGTTIGTLTTYTGNTPQTGDAYARIGAPAGASLSADVAAVEAQTDDIGSAGAGLTALASASSLNTVGTNVNNINTKLGTPDVTIADDIAGIEGGGGGGVADWDNEEKAQIRFRLGLDGTTDTPSATANLATQASVDDLPTNSELDTALDGVTVDLTPVTEAIEDVDDKLGTPADGTIAEDIANVEASVEAVEITPTVEVVGGGPFEQDKPKEAFTIKLGTRRDGTASVDRPIRIRPGETRKWAVDCSVQSDVLIAMEEPSLSGNGDLSVGTTEGTYGVNNALAMFTVTAQSDATGTATIELEITPKVGETLLISVPVKVIQ